MKHLKKMFALLLALCVVAALTLSPAMAAGNNNTYTVRILSGGQGTITGSGVSVYIKNAAGNYLPYSAQVTYDGDMVVCRNLPYGARVDFNYYTGAKLNDEDGKYYIRGIRESGLDNNTVSTPSINVTQDIDYVVAYGILGNSVAYTVNYVDTEGNALLPSQTYYGNVGDKPVVSYLYVEGYQPQAYNLTRTLSDNAADNVFTFVYSRIAIPTTPETGTGTGTGAGAGAGTGTGTDTGTGTGNEGTGTGTGTGTGNEGTGTGTGNEGTGAGNEPGTGTGTGENPNGGTNIPDTNTPSTNGPQEVVDLDTPEVPLAGPGANGDGDGTVTNSSESAKKPLALKIAAGGGAAAIVGGGIWWLIMLKRKKDSKEIEEL